MISIFKFFENIFKLYCSGTSITNLLPNTPQNIDLSYTFNGQYLLPPDADSPLDHSLGHTVEDFNNLGVAVWIQDVDSKYILQSTEASLVADIHENKKNKLLCFPNPSSGTLNLILPVFTGHYKLEMYNLIGEKVYETNVSSIGLLGVVFPNTCKFFRIVSFELSKSDAPLILDAHIATS